MLLIIILQHVFEYYTIPQQVEGEITSADVGYIRLLILKTLRVKKPKSTRVMMWFFRLSIIFGMSPSLPEGLPWSERPRGRKLQGLKMNPLLSLFTTNDFTGGACKT